MKIDQVKLKVSPAEHIEWLKTFGHVHKGTIALIERQHKLISDMVDFDVKASVAMDAMLDYLRNFDKTPD